MKNLEIHKNIVPLIALAGLLALTDSARATPYACDITNAAGVVSFRLNEAADNVKVISASGTNDLGVGVKGLTVTNLGLAAGTVKIMATRSAPAGYAQSSVDGFLDANSVYVNKFEQPRGVTVDKNPASPTFGRIYVANGKGQANTGGSFVRTTFQGIYMLNADDSVALNTGVTPRTAGLGFTPGNSVSPIHLSMNKDDNRLYITDDSDPSGGLWVTDADVATNSIATNVIWQIGDQTVIPPATNHGSMYSAWVEGSLANNNLTVFTMDEDLVPTRSAWRYDINGGPLPSSAPQVGLGQTMVSAQTKIVRGGVSNYLYASQNRSAGNEAGVRVFKTDGTSITNSLNASRDYLGNQTAVDLFRNTTAIDISPDGNTLALLRGLSFGTVLLVPLTNGVFDIAHTNFFTIASGASDSERDISYDAAGNLYVVNNAGEWLRIFSKGGAAVTIVGTDGSFVQGVPPTLVSVTATTPTANEQGPVNGVFNIARTGDTSVPLVINYTIGGTATPGSDYPALSGSVTLLAGAASTNLTVQVVDDAVPELTETVILTISGSANYGVTGGSATVSILDNEPTEVSIALAQTESRLLEGYSGCKLGFRATRRGLIGPALTVNLGYSGTAVRGADFNGPTTIAIGANTASATFNLTPIDDEIYEGTETIAISVIAGSGYAIGAPTTANATVIDDDYPTGTLLFGDNFNTDSSANWIVNHNDDGSDSHADFAFDYSTLFVPAVPGSSGTIGLRFRLNELTNAPRNAVTISPAVLNLPTDYRMKFKAWINYNGPMLDGGSGSTMHLNTGVGTTPDHANLATYGGSDGIWFDVDGDGGSTTAVGDINAYADINLQADDSGVYFADSTNSPRSTTSPYYSIWGGLTAPAAQLANFSSQTGTQQGGNMGMSWHTFVVSKETNAVTFIVDGVPIATVPANATALGANVFVGFEDIFAGASGNTAMSFILLKNFRIETLVASPIAITSITTGGGNVQIDFTAGATDIPGAFTLQSSASVAVTPVDVSATITQLSPGVFRAVRPQSGDIQFYRVRR